MKSSLRFLLSLALAGPVLCPAAPGHDDELRLAVIVTRHGVRPPTSDANRAMGKFAVEPWPKWEAPDGWLTPYGKHLMALIGAYYQEYYTRAGLLAGSAAGDAPRIYFRADSDERTIESGAGLAVGLLPGLRPDLHARPQGQNDPLFHPVPGGVGLPDLARAEAELRGRIGNDPSASVRACAAAYAALERVLLGRAGPPPPGKALVLSLPARVQPDERAGGMATLAGPLVVGHRCAEDFMLEYADAKPAAEVGWGRVDRRSLEELMWMEWLFFDQTETALYRTQTQVSNLASHLRDTLAQAASGRPVPGAIGGPEARMVVVVGHDTTLVNLAAILGLSWWLDGLPPNPTLPGGALIFELRRHARDGRYFVRARYVSQTLDQMRRGETLSLDHPPAEAPIFIPGCSTAGPGYDAPLERFEALIDRVIDPGFVRRDPR